jgi:hypothetical protein
MEKDERLEALCKEFSSLEDSEKDYILGVSQAMSFAMSVERKQKDARSESMKPPDKPCTPS